jgi:hypothetical protein
MLKITVSNQGSSRHIIRLEGKLLQAWVDEVRRLVVEANPSSLPGLDHSGLSLDSVRRDTDFAGLSASFLSVAATRSHRLLAQDVNNSTLLASK